MRACRLICAGLLLGTGAARAIADDPLASPQRPSRSLTFGAIVVPEIYATDIAAPAPASGCSSIGAKGCDCCQFDHIVGFGPWPVRVCCQPNQRCDSPLTPAACAGSGTARIVVKEDPPLEYFNCFTFSLDGQGACGDTKAACCESQAGCAVDCQTAACAGTAKCSRGGDCALCPSVQGLRVSIPACETLGECGACFEFSCSTDVREGEDHCQSGQAVSRFTRPLLSGNPTIIIQRAEPELSLTACSPDECCEEPSTCCTSKDGGCDVACQTASCESSACEGKCAGGECCRRGVQAACDSVADACPLGERVAPRPSTFTWEFEGPCPGIADVRQILDAQINRIEGQRMPMPPLPPHAAWVPAVQVGPHPAEMGSHPPAVESLRHAAQVLEQAACQLEDQELYARADQLRGLAAELRHDARGDRHSPAPGPNVQVIRPMATPDALRHELDQLHEQLQRVRKALKPHAEHRLH